jgi:cytochrome c
MIIAKPVVIAAAALLLLRAAPTFAAGAADKGAQVFGACAACHSLKPGEHLTGPSLANVLGRKAGTAPGYDRYSQALRRADVTWDEKTLDAWIANPRQFIPENFMAFPGIPNRQQREDLIAFLKEPGAVAQTPRGMMGGMMAAPQLEDLKKLDAAQQVTAIRYCKGSYFVTTAAGKTIPYWEFNLRFKTDASANGPAKGKPALTDSGMRGDRAFVVFSAPGEISAFIKRRCE